MAKLGKKFKEMTAAELVAEIAVREADHERLKAKAEALRTKLKRADERAHDEYLTLHYLRGRVKDLATR